MKKEPIPKRSFGWRIARITLLLLFLLLVAAAAIMGPKYLSIATSYSAKTACSCIFLSGRSMESVQRDELANLGYVKLDVDASAKTVSADIRGLAGKTAVYREGLGCSLLRKGELTDVTLSIYAPGFDPDTLDWPAGDRVPEGEGFPQYDPVLLQQALDEAFSEPFPDKKRNCRAVLVVYDTVLMAERYADGIDRKTRLTGWSMTKSVTNNLIGILVGKGLLDVDAPASVPEWSREKDPRHQIRLKDLMQMSSGLAFSEIYDRPADATHMLFLESSTGTYAAKKPLEAKPGSRWQYSSGTTNILSRLIRQTVGEAGYHAFPRQALFGRIGMGSAVMEPDPSGTYVGSSYMFATARDWARLGIFWLHDGVWQGERILPEGWMEWSTMPASAAPQGNYGAQFWLNAGSPENRDDRPFPALPTDLFFAAGFEGQFVFVIPSRNLVIVRLGQTANRDAFDREAFVGNVLKAFP